MKNISNLDDLLSLNNKITKARHNYNTAIGIIILGCALTAIGSFINPEHDALMLSAIAAGMIITVVGVIKLCLPSSRIIYTETGEPLKKFDIYYDSEYDGAMLKDIQNCTFDSLKKMAQSHGSKKLATVYATPSGKFRIAQIFNFVPYEYKPFSEPIVIAG